MKGTIPFAPTIFIAAGWVNWQETIIGSTSAGQNIFLKT